MHLNLLRETINILIYINKNSTLNLWHNRVPEILSELLNQSIDVQSSDPLACGFQNMFICFFMRTSK